MLDRSRSLIPYRDLRIAVAVTFFKAVVGLGLVFVIAAILAPSLFDRRDTVMAVAAFVLWLICPLILFLVGFEVFADIRRLVRRPHP